MIPKTIKNFNGFIDGQSYAGRITEIALPDLTVKTEEHKAGGMDMPVEIDMGLEALVCTMTHVEYDPALIETFGLTEGEGKAIVARGSQERGATAEPVIFTIRGRAKKIPGGTFSDGKTELQIEYACTYAKLEIGNREVFEIDAENMVRRIGGTDQMAERRKALGLA